MNVNDLKILICDDSLLSRKKLKDCISKLNCASIYEAADGEEAVSSFRDNRPDIVFMDIIMPKKAKNVATPLKISGSNFLKSILKSSVLFYFFWLSISF